MATNNNPNSAQDDINDSIFTRLDNMSNDITDLRHFCDELKSAHDANPLAYFAPLQLLNALRGFIEDCQPTNAVPRAPARNSLTLSGSQNNQLNPSTGNAQVQRPKPNLLSNVRAAKDAAGPSAHVSSGHASRQSQPPKSRKGFSVHPLLKPHLQPGPLTDMASRRPMAMHPRPDAPEFSGRFNFGYVEPREDRAGNWEFFSEGLLGHEDRHYGTAEEVAHRVLGNYPSADQVQEFGSMFRIAGQEDITEGIDICWVPAGDASVQDGYLSSMGSQSKDKGKAKAPGWRNPTEPSPSGAAGHVAGSAANVGKVSSQHRERAAQPSKNPAIDSDTHPHASSGKAAAHDAGSDTGAVRDEQQDPSSTGIPGEMSENAPAVDEIVDDNHENAKRKPGWEDVEAPEWGFGVDKKPEDSSHQILPYSRRSESIAHCGNNSITPALGDPNRQKSVGAASSQPSPRLGGATMPPPRKPSIQKPNTTAAERRRSHRPSNRHTQVNCKSNFPPRLIIKRPLGTALWACANKF